MKTLSETSFLALVKAGYQAGLAERQEVSLFLAPAAYAVGRLFQDLIMAVAMVFCYETVSYYVSYSNCRKQSEGTFKGGVRHGVWTFWHDNGQQMSQGLFKGGKEEGVWTYWFRDGQKMSVKTWKAGKLDGLSVGWDATGEDCWIAIYKNGKQESFHIDAPF